MTVIVDNIELDKNNVEFNNAAEFVRHTDKLVYLTGKAGTGKTTFLKYIKDTHSCPKRFDFPNIGTHNQLVIA